MAQSANASAEQPPCPTCGAARDDHHGDHEREHRQVAQRIGEVRRDGREGPVGLGDHAEDEGGAERRAGERAHRAVEPQRRSQARRACPQQADEADVRRRVDAQVPEVGERRIRRRGDVGQRDGVVDVAGGEAQQAEGEHRPREAFAPGGARRPQAADGDREELRPVVRLVPHPRQDRRDDAEVAQQHRAEADQRRGQQPSLRSPVGRCHLPLGDRRRRCGLDPP